MSNVDFSRYTEFVDAVTSDASKDTEAFVYRVQELKGEGCDIQRLMTAAVGVCAEGGEFMEIVKKMVFQGKPWDKETRYHLLRELGDVQWYVMQCLIALESDMDEIISMNVDKLEKRSAAGRNVADVLADTELIDRCQGVTTTGN